MKNRVATEPDADEWRDEEEPDEWVGYRLGDPIQLADFLAFPERKGRDDLRFGRNDQGRLCLMAPDDVVNHRTPMAGVLRLLFPQLPSSWWIIPEPGLYLPRFRHLRGHVIRRSKLGSQAIESDLGVFDRKPTGGPAPVRGRPAYLLDGLQLVLEVLSPSTFRNDLGQGKSDNVDRWRSYLEAGVPELWIVNVGVGRPCPLPPRSGLFLRNAKDRWEPLPVDDPVECGRAVHGIRPLSSGRVRSGTGAVVDLAALWDAVG